MKINTALILCAGLGKRLNPLTLTKPKPLLELDNLTILERCINVIIKFGATDRGSPKIPKVSIHFI